jgi:hypothetical protein
MSRKFWIDKRGREIHADNVKASDKLRDEMINRVLDKVKEMKKRAEEAKADILEEIDGYIELMKQEYKINPVDTTKGNMSFESYDGLKKVSLAVNESVEFDEKLVFAKAKIDEFLKHEMIGATPTLKTLVSRVFEVDKKGNINVKRVLELKAYDISAPQWKEAMQIIDDSISIGRSSTYLRFYEKLDRESKWEQVTIDNSRI